MLLEQVIKNKKEGLHGSNLICLDVNLSNKEIECLNDLTIERELDQFNYYGDVGDELNEHLLKYLSSIGTNTEANIDCVANLVYRISEGMMKGFDKESVWTMLRVTLPNDNYGIPRWHSDGRYFDTKEKVHKMAITLKGPLTLFGRVTDSEKYEALKSENNKNFQENILAHKNQNKFKDEDLRIRKKLLNVIETIRSCDRGCAGIYLVGDDSADIHSEPKLTTSRLFLSVLTGSLSQIKEWEDRTNKKQ